jgi:hypothetical protein
MNDAWKWEVIEAWHEGNSRLVVAAGECENYQACRVAMKLLGLDERQPPADHSGKVSGTMYFVNGKRVFVEYTRLSDNFKMVEWGVQSIHNSSPNPTRERFPSGMNSGGM